MTRTPLDRRRFLFFSGAAASLAGAGAAELHDGELGAPPATYRGAVPWKEGKADSPPPQMDQGAGYVYFTPAEGAFIEAAVERLIPSDPTGPGAVEARVPFFIDRQLAGPFGRGDHYYLGGPWPKGTTEQGYQTRFSPAQLYRAAIAAIDRHVSQGPSGGSFAQLKPEAQDELLRSMESGALPLEGGADAKTFFAMLLQNTREGYFSDPLYGGNKDMAAWKMIGFPGAHYDYEEWVGRHGERVTVETVGLQGRPAWRQG